MSGPLDISLHGAHRVEIIEKLVHICRYSPGLVYLVGEPGKSPVGFLQQMADLVRDELDLALLTGDVSHNLQSVCASLMKQWFVYRAHDDLQTDSQSLHHFLDVGAQGKRMALIVVERAGVLDEDALDFLVTLMARHSCLTVLFAGVVDSRALLRRAQQYEIPVHRIELPDKEERVEMSRQDAMRHRDAQRDGDLFGYEDENVAEPPLLTATRQDYTARVQRAQVDPPLGVSARLAAIRTWGAETFAGLRQRRRSGVPLLIVSIATLGALLLVGALYYPGDSGVSSSTMNIASPVVVDKPVAASSVAAVQAVQSPPAITSSVAVSSVPASSSAQGNDSVAASKSLPSVSPGDAAGLRTTTAQTGAVQNMTASQSVAPASAPPVVGLSSASPAAPEVAAPSVPEAGAVAAPKEAAVKSKSKSSDPVRAVAGKPVAAKPAAKGHAAASAHDWQSQPRTNFTVQLAAAHGESSVRSLAARLPKTHPSYIYRTQRDGKPWFVLVYGSFQSKDAAESARKEVSALLKGQSNPWVRKIGDVMPK